MSSLEIWESKDYLKNIIEYLVDLHDIIKNNTEYRQRGKYSTMPKKSELIEFNFDTLDELHEDIIDYINLVYAEIKKENRLNIW